MGLFSQGTNTRGGRKEALAAERAALETNSGINSAPAHYYPRKSTKSLSPAKRSRMLTPADVETLSPATKNRYKDIAPWVDTYLCYQLSPEQITGVSCKIDS